jgi:purine catabolism regulator
VHNFFADRGLHAVVVPGEMEIVAVAEAGPAGSGIRKTAAALASCLPSPEVVVGAAEAVHGHQDLRVGLVQAREAARTAQAEPRRTSLVLGGESQSHQLLIALLDEESKIRFARTVIGPVIEYDRRNNSDLLASLRTFLASDGKLARAAEHLYVHVNTLRKRLARIGELTGRDIDSVEGRTDFVLALTIEYGRLQDAGIRADPPLPRTSRPAGRGDAARRDGPDRRR